jgi:hypothetical protein
MKRNKFWNLALWIGLSLSLASTAMAQVDDDDDDEITDARAPIQLYLQANISDHVNLQITEDRIRRIVSLIDKYRKEHPDAGVTATVLFSGAVSEALAERNAQTHIVDLVKDAVRRGAIEVGYDGTDEPTYKNRPLVEMKENTPEGRWLARATTAEKFLTEARDPITGAREPGKTGGLKKMQEVFGEAACVTGIGLSVPTLANITPDFGSDSEAVHQLRRYNKQAVMFGLPDENPLHSVAYRGWSEKFSKDLSPYLITAPEVFWQDGVLRTSEAVGVDNQLFRANNGAAAFSYVLKRLDRNKVRVIHIELASERAYLTKPFRNDFTYPPTRYAYAHPDHPALPSEALVSKSAVDAAFVKEDELLDWLTDDFLPDHRESRFLSNTSLKKMTAPAWGFDVPMTTLRPAVLGMLKAWGDQPEPPKYLSVGDFYFLSLAETFQVLADALTDQQRSGKLPSTVRVAEVHGPLQVASGLTPVLGEVTAESVAKIAADLAAKLSDETWRPVPNNVIPISVKIDGLNLNPAQFLRLMAEALVAASPNARLEVKAESMFASRDYLGMRTRAARDMGVVWTYKPAPLSLSGPLVSVLK